MRVLRLIADWPLWLYNLALIVTAPVVLLLKAWRYWKKGWKREYDLRRWWCPVRNASVALGSPHVVIVATGWGELRIAEMLDRELKQRLPHVHTTWILRDGEAAESAMKQHPQQPISFLPFDFLFPVLLSWRRLSPDAVVFVEKFWFPTFVRVLHDLGAKLIVVNARTRAHASARYKLFEPFHHWIASSFDVMMFQSEEDRDRAQRVLHARTQTAAPGNLKFALRPLPAPEKSESLRAWLGSESTPVLAAGSLEKGDLDFVLQAFEGVRRTHGARLLVAPRRLEAIAEIQETVRSHGLSFNRRSQETASPADVFFLDTMGELATAYQFCTAAFIGGTLKTGAGHNVVEPLVFGVPVSYGPNRGFFESVQRACEDAGVGFRVSSSAELASHWVSLLEDKILSDEVRNSSERLLEEQSQALTENVQALVSLVEKV